MSFNKSILSSRGLRGFCTQIIKTIFLLIIVLSVLSCGYLPVGYSIATVSNSDGSHFGISANGEPYWQREYPLMLNLEEGSSVIGFPLQFQDELKGTNRTFYKELRQAKLRVKKTENWTIVRISQIYYGGSGGEFFFGGALSENQNTSGTTNKDNLASQKWVRKSRLGGMTFSKGFIRNADVVNNTFNKTIQGIIDENNQMGFDY